MSERGARPPLKHTGKVVAWGLAFYAAVQLAGALLAMNPAGAAAVQAALAEWGAGIAGVSWTEALAPAQGFRALARRAGSGAALGLAAGALVVVFVLLTRAAVLTSNAPAASPLIVGLLVRTLLAVRDELLLRGLVLRAMKGFHPLACIGACGLAGAAAAFGTASAATTPLEIALAAVEGLAFAALWGRDGGAWLAVGAHAACLWATGPVISGGLLDVRFADGAWGGGGDSGLRSSVAGITAAGAIAAASIAWELRRASTAPRSA